MTNRERFEAIYSGKHPDRIPWAPRLEFWYSAQKSLGTLPERFQGMSLRECEKELGVATPARSGPVFRIEYRNIELKVQEDDLQTITEFVTPKGSVRMVERRGEEEARFGLDKIITEHPIKDWEDYNVWMYVVEHMEFIPTYEEFETYAKDIGDDGFPGMIQKYHCPFHAWLKDLTGYSKGYLDLADCPGIVEDLIRVMAEKDQEMWDVVCHSPAKLIHHGKHLSTHFTPPKYFDTYVLPYYQEFSARLHARGKLLAMHGDNDTRAILPNIQAAGFDMVECFVTAPMVKVTLEEARKAWGTSVIIWGGVPSIILETSFPEEEFDAYMLNLFNTIAPGDAFILGIADNAMAYSMISRVEKITRMVEKFGNYPIVMN